MRFENRSRPRSAAARLPRALAVTTLVCAAVSGGGAIVGCRQERPLPPQPIPQRDGPDAPRMEREGRRPLPADAGYGQMGFPEDAPLLDMPPPEAGPFVEAYNAVGRPKIVVFVNRTLEGAIVPTTEERLLSGRRRVTETTGAADIRRTDRSDSFEERGGYYRGRYGERDGGRLSERQTQREDSFTTTGPTRVEERSEVYLPAGEYDEIWANRIDYAALENALADAMGVRGEVTVMSPQLVRQRLNAEEIAALEAGRPAVLEGLAERLGADVLVHVQARPTAQTTEGLDLRIVAEAVNTVGGESVGRANADFPGPMSAARLDRVSRYLARRLMDDMTGAWLVPPPPTDAAPGQPSAQPPSTTTRP